VSATTTKCDFALDGNNVIRNTNIYYSGQSQGDWFEVDLGKAYPIVEVVLYNRLSKPFRTAGASLQLLDSNRIVTAQRTLDDDFVQIFSFSLTSTSITAFDYICEDTLSGGHWALVRQCSGDFWHPSTDRLKGIDIYGTYGDTTFSVDFRALVVSNADMLFTNGLVLSCVCQYSKS
jgi:hypothetical protein